MLKVKSEIKFKVDMAFGAPRDGKPNRRRAVVIALIVMLVVTLVAAGLSGGDPVSLAVLEVVLGALVEVLIGLLI